MPNDSLIVRHNGMPVDHLHLDMLDDFLCENHLIDALDRLDVLPRDLDHLLHSLYPWHLLGDFLNMGHWHMITPNDFPNVRHLDMPGDFLCVNHLLDALDRLDVLPRNLDHLRHSLDPWHLLYGPLHMGHWHKVVPNVLLRNSDHNLHSLDPWHLFDSFLNMEHRHMNMPNDYLIMGNNDMPINHLHQRNLIMPVDLLGLEPRQMPDDIQGANHFLDLINRLHGDLSSDQSSDSPAVNQLDPGHHDDNK